jgi:hypothetical protein
MFTAKDEYKSHGPHTDDDYKVLVKGENGNKLLLRNIHFEHGSGIMFRSNVVHAGGHIEVDMEKGQKYHHLHFCLSSKFQVANPEEINYWHHDLRTLLKDIYLVPMFPTEENEDKAEKSASDGIDWEEDDKEDEDNEEEVDYDEDEDEDEEDDDDDDDEDEYEEEKEE